MDRRIFSYLIVMIIIKASVATYCTINDKGDCYFTINCDVPAKINQVISCDDTDPFITLVINESPVLNATANFFNTQFDVYVRILIAVGNSWDAVENYAFSNFKNVSYMDLSQNQINSIDKPFIGLEKMTSLNLSRNHLEVIKADLVPENRNRLSLIDLSYNLLTYIPDDLFVNMRYLRQLYLQGNKLMLSGNRFLTNLKNLNYLNMCCSNLTTLDITLKYLKSLTELDLSFNHLQQIDLCELVSLETINLSHNNIEEFMFDCFEQFENLESIDLSYCKLQKVYGADSVGNDDKKNKPLIDIYLNNNNISYIDKTFTDTFNNIRILDLSYNKIAGYKPKRLYSRSYVESRYY